MLEIASLDRDEYRRLRAEMWRAAAGSNEHKNPERLRDWMSGAS